MNHRRIRYRKEDLVVPKQDQADHIQKLIKGCAKEDRNSQKELYRHFYSFSMSICLRYASNQMDAAGILNEGFFKVFSNIKKYDFSKPFTAWLGRIMTNTAIDYYRANLKFAYSEDISDYDQISSYQTAYEKLNYQDLLSMIQQLSPAYRTVFNLYAIEGYTHEEIAKTLNISIGTSKSNLFKARTKLMNIINQTETGFGKRGHDLNDQV